MSISFFVSSFISAYPSKYESGAINPDNIFVPSKGNSLLNIDFLFLHLALEIGVVKNCKSCIS